MPTDNSGQPPLKPPPLQGASGYSDSDMLERGETVLSVVHRSVIGLVATYAVLVVAIAAIFGLIIAISPSSFESDAGGLSPSMMAIIALSALLTALFIIALTHIYRQSRLIITDKSLVQIMQKTLFSRKVSRLSMSDVEDVSAEQRGIIASLFGYGTLVVQTAGERENFIFTLCPMPQKFADRIIEARQKFIEDQDDHTP
jgi:membrane protein YdbS with pleckstrin-like domain